MPSVIRMACPSSRGSTGVPFPQVLVVPPAKVCPSCEKMACTSTICAILWCPYKRSCVYTEQYSVTNYVLMICNFLGGRKRRWGSTGKAATSMAGVPRARRADAVWFRGYAKAIESGVWLLWLMLLNAVWTVKRVTECIKTRYFEWEKWKNFWGGGTAPSPDLSTQGRGIPPPRPRPLRRLRRLDSRAVGTRPPYDAQCPFAWLRLATPLKNGMQRL